MIKSNQNAESMMSGSFAWVCICILEGGRFSFLDADADLGTTGLALTLRNESVAARFMAWAVGKEIQWPTGGEGRGKGGSGDVAWG
jgi:hypothetical protein